MAQRRSGRGRPPGAPDGSAAGRSPAGVTPGHPRPTGRALAAGALAVLVLLTGCSGGSPGSAGGGAAATPADAGAERVVGAEPARLPAAGGPAVDTAGSVGAGPGAVGPAGAGALVGRDVVVRGTLSVTTDDVTAVARAAADAAVRAGGYVEQESTGPAGGGTGGRSTGDRATGDRASRTVQLTLRVPTAAFAGLREEIAALGQEESRSLSSEDVTDQVLDVEARLATQRASVERVRALLARAADLSEVVAVEAELTRRQAELESLQARSDALSAQVRLATLVVHVGDPATRLAAAAPGFTDGLVRGWAALGAATGALLTVAGLVLPAAAAVALVAVPVLVLRRRRSNRPRPLGAPAP